ncbi:intermembrane space import and assembly protein 40 [Emericellopsis atlantica]|uniref:Mitochondrial intermembrane space import and assembly protein 40 n=1 Tax=Emericellopsis atlantica TaxID=2614577 RepID=A0A9P7ZV24_9HYPO|nr:intermembrane space import and assembly protein 40 [Emericellopsis atlantica]KAG9258760.1 intermembrane space import and assembly protein 40 [Emericellopsis atlantica]
MYRTSLRSAARPLLRSVRSQQPCSRRFASTKSPADRPRSWKSSALRWGAAGAALYYYNTSNVFAEESAPRTVAAPPSFDESELPTVDSVLEEKRKQIQKEIEENTSSVTPEPIAPQTTQEAPEAQGAGALEEEAGQEGAFNPETGEINWDCPCLGGMAHGPCGEEFKTAFSCFVFSTEEPKGMDCIEKFSGMQECFRQYPEIYGAELADDEEADTEGAAAASPEASTAAQPKAPADATEDQQQLRSDVPASAHVEESEKKLESAHTTGVDVADSQAPPPWEDATDANKDSKAEETPAEANKEDAEGNKKQ